MKRMTAVLLVVLTMVAFTGCIKQKDEDGQSDKYSESDSYHEMVTEAQGVLVADWRKKFAVLDIETDGYFQIKNTRLIVFKDNDDEYIQDVAYVVEFAVWTDYFGTSPYYMYMGFDDCVVVYKDGTMKVENSPILQYRSRTYSNDFSSFMDSVRDYQDQYNVEKYLK